MKIVRIEEGTYVRNTTLEIDGTVASAINKSLEEALVENVGVKPLTVEEIWNIMLYSVGAARYNEEYLINYNFYHKTMKLGDFVRCEINNIFEELPGEIEDENISLYTDEFYP